MMSWAYILLGMFSVLAPLCVFFVGVVCLSVYQHRRDARRALMNELVSADLREQSKEERQAAYNRGVVAGRSMSPTATISEEYSDTDARPRWDILREG